jgi:flagellar basal-body rod protein FlgG
VKKMLRGIYTAGAGMIAQQRRQEMLTDNITNANTPGFKADQASLRSFPNQLIKAIGTGHAQRFGSHTVGELTTGVYLQERTPDFRQGDIQETGNTTDVALLQSVVPVNEETGEEAMLVFSVETDGGDVRFTRNGSFAFDGEGFLTTPQGNYVLDLTGERINIGNEDIRIAENGEIFSAADDELIAQINVGVIEDPSQLVKEGNGLLRYDGENEIATAVGNEEVAYQLQQGFVERSNVDAARTMTEMMTALRSFEANQRVLQAYDRSLERTVNDVGRIG